MRWLFLAPLSIIAFLVSYTISYWVLHFTTALFLPDRLYFLLAWPNSAIASSLFILTAFWVAPFGKSTTVFVMFVFNTVLYGFYVALVFQGELKTISPAQALFELIGGILGSGATTFYLIREYSRKGYAKVITSDNIDDDFKLPGINFY